MPGRPRDTRQAIHIHIHLRLYEGEDDDLLQVFQQVPKRQLAGFLKSALRSGQIFRAISTEGPDDDALSEQSLENFLH